jgi:cob(I)alamin adenosyltransferase
MATQKTCADCGGSMIVNGGAKKYCASCSDARTTARKAEGNAERLRRRRERLKHPVVLAKERAE